MAGFATAPATLANLAHLTPRPIKGLFGDNYLSLADMDFTQQFLPEVYEKEIERYGNRTITGFLRMVGAEMPMASDQVVWSEQGRLHIAYDTAITAAAAAKTISLPAAAAGPPVIKAPLLGPNMTIVISKGNVTAKAFVVSLGAIVAGNQVYNIVVYDTANGQLPTGLHSQTGVSLFVYGSEYGKGSSLAGNSVDASFTTFSNKPIILRDKYAVNGSDVAQIGWVEVTTEIGTGGYLWYLKSEHESRIRFEDYLEMSMVEATDAQGTITDASTANISGMQGLFDALETRGLVFNDADFDGASSATAGLGAFDTILQELDKQGAIEENVVFVDRDFSFDIDDMLSLQSSNAAGGVSYGLFDNEKEMALNLGFTGFRRGYDFYKSDWKYLNDPTMRGGLSAVAGSGRVNGLLVPAGSTSVYDQILGKNAKRPFLHVRYRASATDDRRMKTWTTGSVGAATSALDAMQIHMLSERCLITQGANNFMLMK